MALNLSDEPVSIDARGEVLIGTAGQAFDGELAPWSGVVLDG